MSAGYVAATVRVRPMLARLLPSAAVESLARSPSAGEALELLAQTPYGPRLDARWARVDVEHALRQAVLDDMNVIGRWMPSRGAGLVRAGAAYFELRNLLGRAAELAGGPAGRVCDMGHLWTVAPQRLAGVTSRAELNRLLAASPWGDPGELEGAALEPRLERRWLRRLEAAAGRLPRSRGLLSALDRWLGAGGVVRAARLRFVRGLSPQELRAVRSPWPHALREREWRLLLDAPDLARLVAAAPRRHAWALADVEAPGDLWRAETAVWRLVTADSRDLSARTRPAGPEVVAGYVALKAAEVGAVVGALEQSARAPGQGLPPGLVGA